MKSEASQLVARMLEDGESAKDFLKRREMRIVGIMRQFGFIQKRHPDERGDRYYRYEQDTLDIDASVEPRGDYVNMRVAVASTNGRYSFFFKDALRLTEFLRELKKLSQRYVTHSDMEALYSKWNP